MRGAMVRAVMASTLATPEHFAGSSQAGSSQTGSSQTGSIHHPHPRAVAHAVAAPMAVPSLHHAPARWRTYHRFPSRHLGGDLELLWFGHAGIPLLAFPTRCGRFYELEDQGMVAALQPRLDAGELQLCCVDGRDAETLYAGNVAPWERLARHQRYEACLLSEVLPFMRERSHGLQPGTFGCSLGAYHALTLAARHPARFRRVVAFSGRYDLCRAMADYRDLFDGWYGDGLYFHNPSHFLPNLRDAEVIGHLRRIEWTIAIGDGDPFLADNLHVAGCLTGMGVPHRLHRWEGRAHSFRAWRQMAALLL
jgi:esterase/lipase superfamily enzyme